MSAESRSYRSLIPAVVLAVASLAGCGVEVCESEAPPAPFEAIAGDFPSEAVFCAMNPEKTGLARVDFPAPGEDWPDGVLPNTAHMNFDLETPHDAWMKVVDTFEAKGWERVDQSTGDMLAVTFAHVEKGYVLDFSVINNNSADNPLKKDRVHAHVVVKQAPCHEMSGSQGAACAGSTLVQCTNGVITGEVDCAAEQKTCGADMRKAACVSDLCLAGHAGTGKWNPDACPAELSGT